MAPPRNRRDPAALEEFSRGTLDVIRTLSAALIGRGVLEADSLSADMNRLSEFWRSKDFPQRAEPAEILAEALGGMEKTKRDVAADIFPTPKGMQ
jgi:hypothetical protein